jgi:hypothetical protein
MRDPPENWADGLVEMDRAGGRELHDKATHISGGVTAMEGVTPATGASEADPSDAAAGRLRR